MAGRLVQLNGWGAHVETELTARSAQTESADAELRGAVLLQAAELQTLRDGLVLMEHCADRATQFGSQAVAELHMLMQAFRAELVLSKTEQQQLRFQEADALKTELREFVTQVEARFGTVEAAVGDFPAAPATAASSTTSDGQDPWCSRCASPKPWSGGAGAASPPQSGQFAHFAVGVDNNSSPAQAGPPGFSRPQGSR